jgi:hypothetical protein
MGIVLDLTRNSLSHPSEEVLDDYVLNRLPEALAAPVEEHLLICLDCQDAVAETDRFVSAMKIAAGSPDFAIGQVRSGWQSLVASSGASLVPIFILAMLAFLAVRKPAPEPLGPITVNLASLRGPDPMASAPVGRPLVLSIDAPGLAVGGEYRVDVVDAGGGPVWKGPVTESGGKLVARMPKPLAKGVYWVRLYGADWELLREFGMSAK